MAVHKPSVLWGLRPKGNVGYVRTAGAEAIQIVAAPLGRDLSFGAQVIEISRKDARLLAKRINQCLDGTRSK